MPIGGVVGSLNSLAVTALDGIRRGCLLLVVEVTDRRQCQGYPRCNSLLVVVIHLRRLKCLRLEVGHSLQCLRFLAVGSYQVVAVGFWTFDQRRLYGLLMS
jgi:hypothetical protein